MFVFFLPLILQSTTLNMFVFIVIQIFTHLSQQHFLTNWPVQTLEVKTEVVDEEPADLHMLPSEPMLESLVEPSVSGASETLVPDDPLDGSSACTWVVEAGNYLCTAAAPAISEALDMIESVRNELIEYFDKLHQCFNSQNSAVSKEITSVWILRLPNLKTSELHKQR